MNAFVWHRGQRRALDAPPTVPDATATRMNDRGDVVGNGSTETGFTTVVWFRDGTSMVVEVPPDAFGLGGVDINNRMAVLTHLAYPGEQSSLARVWFEGMITDYKRLPGSNNAQPLDFNNRDTVVGISSFPDTDPEPKAALATIWRRGVPSDLNTLIAADDPLQPFVRFRVALLINDLGQIVVQGTDSRDDPFTTSYYLLTPVR
jgi:hypothetical protein